ncbi:carboxypeptidase regulatory-like domain-containing protein [Mucilaginibacter ximonensis]|uniref:Carboxypeptidase regulatory-like domain-containing protein n=1 Tax=Mucilaginibacter ximonensis TaxID=538021 RepID=A0ABW5YGC5_9SPHI
MKQSLKLILKTCACCLVIGLMAFIPRDDDPFAKIMANLQRWTDSIPQEKVYLHTDKPYYALGDTIWFKGYLTVGPRHQLSSLSGAMYVELINDRDSLLQQLKLPVTAGMVMGDFILGDDFQQGNYRIRAYTRWMRNAGEDYFYDHTFLVGDAGSSVIAKADFDYTNNGGKTQLSALLNYTDNTGNALSEKDIRFEIMRGKKTLWQQNGKTDAMGNLKITIPADVQKNPAGVFIHTVFQGSNKTAVVRDFAIKPGFSQSDVQFFAESGSLVNGITSHVAFKAVGTNGLGINIKGNVTDNESNEVAKIETLHAGMGSFLLNPQPGKSYTANVTFDDGSTRAYPLAPAAAQGYVLSVYQPYADSVLVRIHASKSLLQSNVNFVVHTNGEVVFSAPIKIENTMSTIWLSKKLFPSGIAQFTLFSNTGEPLNERLAFIRSNDQMVLDIKTAKPVYKSKERVQIALNAKNSTGEPTFGNFSVSVVDETKSPVDENKESTIFSNLLLTADLKGYVEQPNYYFAQKGEQVDKALDNLMLTQGYRRFTWKALENTINTKPRFAVEGLGTAISGRVTTLGHRPIANASVILTSLKARVTKLTTTDSLGRFKYDKLFITDSIKFSVQGRNGQSDRVIVEMDTVAGIKVSKNLNWPDLSTDIRATLKAYMNKMKQDDDLYEKLGMFDKMHSLREVNIRAKTAARIPQSQITPQGMYKLPDEQSADQLINVDANEASRYLSLAQYLQARLQGIAVVSGPAGSTLVPLQQNSSYRESSKGITLFLNGRRINNSDEESEILDYSVAPEDVAKIEVVRTNAAMVNYLSGPGVLILTRLGTSRRTYNPGIVNISPKGYNKVREFYSPRYDRPGRASSQPDLRTTVYWNPYLKTDADGNTTFNFFNADGPGTYRVVIEGINADGQLGRQVFRYTVDETQAAGRPVGISTDKNLAKIIAPVDSFNKRLPVEKVYLHTDKPYYNLGDTLWFKSYVLDGVNLSPSHLSGLLYVELVDDSAEVVRRVSMPVKDGLGHGQILLSPGVFKEGGYTLRAYTNWMQNFNGAYVFSQRFYLGLPSAGAWLAKPVATLQQEGNKTMVQANIRLSYANDPGRAVAYKKVEVKLYDEWHYLSKVELQTGANGIVNINEEVSNSSDGRRMRAQITSLEKDDNFKVTQVPLVINRPQKIEVQFLPESGNLVAGIKSIVGFKAIGEDGLGAGIVGGIYDSKDKQVVSFMTLHNGMGSFEFTPQAGENYQARIAQPVVKTFNLPKIQPTGTVMHIDNPEKSDELKISIAGVQSLPADSACYVVGLSRGSVYYSQKVDQNNPSLTVAKNQFPTGITRFTFFSGQKPLNERAVFIENNDNLNISIKPNKDMFLKRDSVGLDIVVKDKSGLPVQGSFSLAVTDDSQVKADSLGDNNIGTSLLLNADLKGHVESPGYYINRKDKQAWRALDNLMLTQGWTGYVWKDIFAQARPVKYKAEREFKITGMVRNILNKPVANQTVLLSSQKPSFVLTTTTDANGRYVFEHLPPADSGSYFIQGQKANGKSMSFGSISVDDKFVPMRVFDIVNVLAMPWYVNTDSVQLNYVKKHSKKLDEQFKMTGHVLQEVKIKDKKIIKNSQNPLGPGNADLIFDEQDIKESETTDVYELLKQKVPGFRVLGARYVNYQDGLVVEPIVAFNGFETVLRTDGSPMILDMDVNPVKIPRGTLYGAIQSTRPNRPHPEYDLNAPESEVIEAMRQLKIPAVSGLEIAYSKKYTNNSGYHADDVAFIQITTKNGIGTYRNKTPGTITYRPLPLLEPKQFYSPKYDVSSKVNVDDNRATIFWEPNITTDQNGRARVSFYSSDIQSKYTVKVAGIDGNGGLGDASIKLTPKNNNATMSTLKN